MDRISVSDTAGKQALRRPPIHSVYITPLSQLLPTHEGQFTEAN